MGCFCGLANAETNKLDNIAACAGVVIGTAQLTFSWAMKQLLTGSYIAYSAYLSEVFTGQAAQNDIQIADQILAVLDKVIAAYNSETFDTEMYEEVVSCYRALSLQLLKAAQVIIDNQAKWSEIKTPQSKL